DGKILASGGSDPKIQLWDVATGKIQASLQTNQQRVLSLAFSPDGTTLASTDGSESGYNSKIKFWNLATQQAVAELRGNKSLSISFSPDGKFLAGVVSEKINVWQGQ
ncbi:WD40 repeat domain-containing protein, partial [Planktothrix sp.]